MKSISFENKEFFNANFISKILIEVHLLHELELKNEEIKKFYQEKIKHNNLMLKFERYFISSAYWTTRGAG